MKTKSIRPLWLTISIVLASLLVSALLGGLGGVTTALADPELLYVDGTSGSDDPACGMTTAPCQTISYTLHTRGRWRCDPCGAGHLH